MTQHDPVSPQAPAHWQTPQRGMLARLFDGVQSALPSWLGEGAEQADAWVLAGDLIYQFDNLDGGTPDDPYYHPVCLANGSQEKMVFAIHDMINAAGGDTARVIPGHEQRLIQRFPWRPGVAGLQIVELSVGRDHQRIVSGA